MFGIGIIKDSKRVSIVSTVALMMITLLFGIMTLSPSISAQSSVVCEGLGNTIGGGDDCESQAGDPTPDSLIKIALNLLSIAAGVASVIMLIIAGLRYITSQGDAQTVAKVRGAIIYVAVGLVIIAMSQIIVKYVIVESTRPPDDGVPGNVR